MKFEELNVRPEIVLALRNMSIVEPTNIQQKAIPLVKEGKDVIGMSKTGSGKTVAFGVPILEKIKPGQGLQALILCPIRELAVQIANELKKFGQGIKFSVTTVYGGVSLDPQMDAMNRADIVVATPGRMLDHLERGNVDLSKVNTFVLDEADKMVEMGFIEDIDKILQCTNKARQILLFGATISQEIDYLKNTYMHNPVTAEAESYVKEDLLEQYYYDLKPQEKFSMLVHLLKKENAERAIIFCSARSTVEVVSRNLRAQKIRNEMIHGKLSQNKRLQIIDNFNKGKTNILVASSVAARGLDVKDISHVFNYDLSQDPQEYIHRIGRTARAGEAGKAITLLCSRDHDSFRQILNRYRVNVDELPRENFEKLRFDMQKSGRLGEGRFSRPQNSYRGNNGSSGRSNGYNRPNSNSSYNRSHGQDENRGYNQRSNGYNRSNGSNHSGSGRFSGQRERRNFHGHSRPAQSSSGSWRAR